MRIFRGATAGCSWPQTGPLALGRLSRPHMGAASADTSARPSKVTGTQAALYTHKLHKSHFQYEMWKPRFITIKNRWKNTNPHFKKGTTPVCTTESYKVTLSRLSLLQRSRQHGGGCSHTPPSTHLSPLHPHVRAQSAHTGAWAAPETGVSMGKGDRRCLPADSETPLLEEEVVILEVILWKITKWGAPFQERQDHREQKWIPALAAMWLVNRCSNKEDHTTRHTESRNTVAGTSLAGQCWLLHPRSVTFLEKWCCLNYDVLPKK